MKSLITLSFALMMSASAFAGTDVAQLAFNSMSAVVPALQEETPNIRVACTSYGMYKAYASLANGENSNQWLLRNLKYGEKQAAIVGEFCSSPRSATKIEQAIAAAKSVDENFGLE